jgi:hypothetical protein
MRTSAGLGSLSNRPMALDYLGRTRHPAHARTDRPRVGVGGCAVGLSAAPVGPGPSTRARGFLFLDKNMSLDASRWAWMQSVGRSSAKLVLLSLADRAGENHAAYPSLQRLHKDTELDIKTIRACLDYLMQRGLIARTAAAGKVAVYSLIGVSGREDTPTKSGTPTVFGTTTKSGTTPLPKTVPPPLPKLVPEPIIEPIKNQSSSKPAPKTTTQDETFDRFWAAYPRKQAKAEAANVWKSQKLTPLADLIVADVTRRRIDDCQWRDPQYIPHPTTYLRQRRWEDEILTAEVAQPQTKPRRMLRDAL